MEVSGPNLNKKKLQVCAVSFFPGLNLRFPNRRITVSNRGRIARAEIAARQQPHRLEIC